MITPGCERARRHSDNGVLGLLSICVGEISAGTGGWFALY